jgi:hypothetical protein
MKNVHGEENIVQGKRGNTTTTLYPTHDGFTRRQGVSENWASITTGAGNSVNNTADIADGAYINGAVGGNWTYRLNQGYVFDTSIISTDEISSAVLSFYVFAKDSNHTGASINVLNFSPASDTSFVNADYQQVGSTKYSSDVAISGITTSAFLDITLNSAGQAAINKTGNTRLAVGFIDQPSSGGSAWTGVGVRYVEYTGTSSDPKLVVEHSAASSTNSGFFAFM